MTARLQYPKLTAVLAMPKLSARLSCSAPPTAAQVVAALQTLDDYPTDEAAAADGVAIGGLYWVSIGSDAAVPGTLRRRTV